MAKENKRKLLFTTAILTILLFSSAYAVLTPNAQAAETPIQGENPVSIPSVNVTTSAIQEKGLPILSNVLGLDLAKYATTSQECPQDLYMGVVPEENVRYYLESNGSKLDMLCTFANGNLRMIHVLESEGSPHMTKSTTSALEMAKGFLSNYQSYSGNSFYGGLASMLDKVDANKDLTKISGNVKLQVNASEGSTTFRWTYTYNDIEAPSKIVALRYKNGFLKYFIDNWNLYKIGSTTVNLSEKEAIDIALERAKTFSWKVGSDNNTFEVKNFNVTQAMIWQTIFCSSLYADEARSEDLLMLYPIRHVWVSLDKFYPGNVYGIEVYVWADTKDICHIQERFSTMDPPADLVATINDAAVEPLNDNAPVEAAKSNSISTTIWIALPVLAVAVLGTVPVWLGRKKNLPKRSFKIGGVLFCLLISSELLLVPISTVSAVEPTRRATIWGSESTGAITTPPGCSWRKTQAEISRQRSVALHISDYFKNDGYTASNYQGSNSLKYEIVGDASHQGNISYNEQNYARVAVVDFDHGVYRTDYPQARPNEPHYLFEDNVGSLIGSWPGQVNHNGAVYDMDIASDTTLEKTFFALINTCLSANITWQGPNNGQPQGMPYAWTHRTVVYRDAPGFTTALNMSDNGYTRPDNGAFCYMGFRMGAAALDQTVTGGYPKYWEWVERFLYKALSFDISINQALDIASADIFSGDFDQTDLYNGFTAIWPMWDPSNGWHDTFLGHNQDTLAVYGNGNIHLYEYFVHDVVSATWYGYNAGVINPNGITGGSNDGNYACLYAVGWYGDEAMIVGSMGYTGANEAHGHIYLYGYSYPGYYSHLYVYVSYDGSNRDYVNNLWISQSSPYWIDVGSHSGNFKYIAVVVYADYAPAVLYVDSVLVIPPLP